MTSPSSDIKNSCLLRLQCRMTFHLRGCLVNLSSIQILMNVHVKGKAPLLIEFGRIYFYTTIEITLTLLLASKVGLDYGLFFGSEV